MKRTAAWTFETARPSQVLVPSAPTMVSAGWAACGVTSGGWSKHGHTCESSTHPHCAPLLRDTRPKASQREVRGARPRKERSAPAEGTSRPSLLSAHAAAGLRGPCVVHPLLCRCFASVVALGPIPHHRSRPHSELAPKKRRASQLISEATGCAAKFDAANVPPPPLPDGFQSG
jgi:hypothetical protein